jgi:histone deacetylase 6
VLNFVSGSLFPVRSETDPSLAHWYKEHSRVYVAADHLCWEDELMQKKVRKSRFGAVVRSQERGLNRMMRAHFGDATEWVRAGLEGSEGEE